MMYEEEAMDIYTEWSNANSSEEAIDAYTEQLKTAYTLTPDHRREIVREWATRQMEGKLTQIMFEQLRQGDVIFIELHYSLPHLEDSMTEYDASFLTVDKVVGNTIRTIEDRGVHDWYFDHILFCWRKITPKTVPLKNNTLPEI